MKVQKAKSNPKTVSSYLLSGINIKKMIADETDLSQNIPNIADATIIKISKRPIFKIIKEKDQQPAQLPSKTFKIRSFTRKLRKNGEQVPAVQNSDMFEKVQKLRHLKSVNNRIQLFNLSAISKFNKKEPKDAQKTQNSEKEYSKMRQVLVNNTEKWRTSSQIIVKERIVQGQIRNNFRYKPLSLEYLNIHTDKYRQLACKINIKINHHFKEKATDSVLLIISLDALQMVYRRVVKSTKLIHYQQEKSQKCKGKFGQEVFEAIKLFTSKQYPFSSVNQKVKICFKVNSWQQSQELKQKLYQHQIEDYFCIFYPNRKYCQIYNLYQIDPLLAGTNKLILIEHKSKLGLEFPIVSNLDCIFFSNYNETLLSLAKLSQAIKSFLSVNQIYKEEDLFEEEKFENSLIFASPAQFKNQYQIKYQEIEIPTSQLQARLNFVNQSRIIKNQLLMKNRKEITSTKRVALDDKTHSINNISQSINFENIKNQKPVIMDRFTTEHLQQRVLSELANKPQNSYFKPTGSKPLHLNSRSEQIDEITNSLINKSLKPRPVASQLAQLVKKNEHIYKQISQYLSRVAELECTSIRCIFQQQQKVEQKASEQQRQKSCLQMIKCIKVL